MDSTTFRDFLPVELSLDDRLPADIQLVMAYRYGIAADACSAALKRGLQAFPHLMGKLEGARILPPAGDFLLETEDLPGVVGICDLEEMPLSEQSATFIPESCADSLFAVRLTQFAETDLSVLGLRVSHAAVDGSGLALFINHCTAALRGCEAPPIFHERSYGFGQTLDGADEPPHGYCEAGRAAGEDAPVGSSATLFAIQAEKVRWHFQAASILDARLKLGAWLCTALREKFSEVALWCDPRGLNGIPATYTGNLGCFLHFPLRGTTAEEFTKQLRATATRSGFQRIAETHRSIKLAELRGNPLAWDGGGRDVLQLNLVPHAVDGTDFGSGVPDFALLLSRNSSGLRISLTPDASRFVIETCLPGVLGDDLLEKCRAAGLEPSPWCRGEKPCK